MILEIIISGLIILGIILTVYEMTLIRECSMIMIMRLESERRHEEYIAITERIKQSMDREVFMEQLAKRLGEQNDKKY
jgi:hypothetical protein